MARCPFCGEPAVRTMVGGIVAYRCGTEGPFVSSDGHSNYQTGRVCDMHTYQRLLGEKDTEIEQLRAEIEELRQRPIDLRGAIGDWYDRADAERKKGGDDAV